MTGRFRLAVLVTLALSLAAVAATPLIMFDRNAVVRTVARANISLILSAVMLGAVVELLRAQRAAIVLRRQHPISLEKAFGAQVLSHATGCLFPLGPAGFGVQSLLTFRLASVPMAFSAGVLLACSVLDRVAVLPLIALVYWTLQLPGWARLLLLGMLIHSVLSLLVPFVALTARTPLSRFTPSSGWGKKIHGAITGVETGLTSVMTGGWVIALPSMALSVLIVAGTFLRLTVLLRAFGLGASPHQVALLVVMGGLVGSMPVKLPGTDAWATGKLLGLTRLIGPGAGGFVLVSSVIALMEAPLLAAAVLVWWALPRSAVSLGPGEFAALALRSRRTAARDAA